MKNVIVNTSIVMAIGVALIPVVLAVVFIPLLRYLACLFLFYVILHFALDGVVEEFKAEQQAKIVDKEGRINENGN